VLGHPFGARQITLLSARVRSGSRNGSVCRTMRATSVQSALSASASSQAQIGHQMFFGISGRIAGRGGLIGNWGIKR
jgi:hypothetical protein